MATKKKAKSGTSAKSKVDKVTKAAVPAAKKTAKKAAKTAKTLLGKLAQRSAQLILDSGVLGEAPTRAPAKKRARKA